jgi:hypothetical protein
MHLEIGTLETQTRFTVIQSRLLYIEWPQTKESCARHDFTEFRHHLVEQGVDGEQKVTYLLLNFALGHSLLFARSEAGIVISDIKGMNELTIHRNGPLSVTDISQ